MQVIVTLFQGDSMKNSKKVALFLHIRMILNWTGQDYVDHVCIQGTAPGVLNMRLSFLTLSKTV